jgi:hypothetical protein
MPQVRRFLFDGATLSAAEISRTNEDSGRDFATAGYGLWLIRETGGTDLVGAAGLRPLEKPRTRDLLQPGTRRMGPGLRHRGRPRRGVDVEDGIFVPAKGHIVRTEFGRSPRISGTITWR